MGTHWLFNDSMARPDDWPEGELGDVLAQMALAQYYQALGPDTQSPIGYSCYQALVVRLVAMVHEPREYQRVLALAGAAGMQALEAQRRPSALASR